MLLFISHHTCSTAQVKTKQNNLNTKTTELEDKRQVIPSAHSRGKYVHLSDRDENKANENQKEPVTQKVKNLAIQEEDQIEESPLLKEISNSSNFYSDSVSSILLLVEGLESFLESLEENPLESGDGEGKSATNLFLDRLLSGVTGLRNEIEKGAVRKTNATIQYANLIDTSRLKLVNKLKNIDESTELRMQAYRLMSALNEKSVDWRKLHNIDNVNKSNSIGVEEMKKRKKKRLQIRLEVPSIQIEEMVQQIFGNSRTASATINIYDESGTNVLSQQMNLHKGKSGGLSISQLPLGHTYRAEIYHAGKNITQNNSFEFKL